MNYDDGDDEVDLEMLLEKETQDGYLLCSDEDAEGIWFARSQVGVARKRMTKSGRYLVYVAMPRWLAEREGLV